MHARDRVWIRDTDGIHETSPVAPAVWHGEPGCVVGPFSSARCARIYLQLHRARTAAARVFPARSAYYVQIRA